MPDVSLNNPPLLRAGLIFGLCLVIVLAVSGCERNTGNDSVRHESKSVEEVFQSEIELSVRWAYAVSEVVGYSISPMLVMTTLGIYRYFRETKDKRDNLPWFNQPWFWMPLLLLLLLVFLKDTLIAALPFLMPVKKPLDALEVVENQVMFLVALPAVVAALTPDSISTYQVRPEVVDLAPFTQAMASSFDGPASHALSLPGALMMIVGLVVFCISWLFGQAVNVLILLSPLSWIDMLLKALRVAVLMLLLLATMISPWLGLALSTLLIWAACRGLAWATRMSVFALVMVACLHGHRRSPVHARRRGIPAFKIAGGVYPKRTLMKLSVEEGNLVFVRRSWFIGPPQTFVPTGHFLGGRYQRTWIGMRLDLAYQGLKGREKHVFLLPLRYADVWQEMASDLVCQSSINNVPQDRPGWQRFREEAF